MKQKFNIHTHTSRCGHARGHDEQYVLAAIEAGFNTLGFSDHIPYPNANDNESRMDDTQSQEYLDSINSLKEKYIKKIDVKVGFEVEYLPKYHDYYYDMRKKCDYLILGQHTKYLGYDFDCFCNDADLDSYCTQIEQGMATNLFTYLAHPDYFLLGRNNFNEQCIKAAHRIGQASIKYDVPLEINLNGFKYGKKKFKTLKHSDYQDYYIYPFYDFWEIIKTYNCKVVYGFDAHAPLSLMDEYKIDIANSIIGDLNLNFIDEIKLNNKAAQ